LASHTFSRSPSLGTLVHYAQEATRHLRAENLTLLRQRHQKII